MKLLIKLTSLDQPETCAMNIDYHSGRNLNHNTTQKPANCEYITAA